MVQFYYRRISAEGGWRDEQYRLVEDPDGSLLVEYYRSHSDDYGAVLSSETLRIPMAQFLAGEHDPSAKAALSSHLAHLATGKT
jgi:hypothetical protein